MEKLLGSPEAEVDALAGELDNLLARHKPVLKEEGIDGQVENLKCWLVINRDDFATDGHLSETGNAWLTDVRDGLKLAADESQRLEGEGGIPASDEQTRKNEELLGVVRRIDKILGKIAA